MENQQFLVGNPQVLQAALARTDCPTSRKVSASGAELGKQFFAYWFWPQDLETKLFI